MNNAKIREYTRFLNLMRNTFPRATVEQLAELCSLTRLFAYYNRTSCDAEMRNRRQPAVERIAARIRELCTAIGTTVELGTGAGRHSVTLTLPNEKDDELGGRQRVPEF